MLEDVFKNQLGCVHHTVQQNLEGITHEDSVRNAAEGGNSLNWVFGHMIQARGGMLKLLGGEALTDGRHGELYGRHTPNIGPGDECTSLDDLRELWSATQAALMERLEAADTALFQTHVPALFDAERQEPKGLQLSTFLFHESYHAGQLGVIRRNVGLVGAIE